MNNSLFKIISIVSVISGGIAGIVALVPFLSFLALCIVMIFTAPFIIVYFKNLNLITDIETDKGILYGGIAGFTGFIGFSAVFFPLAFIIDLIFKTQSFLWVSVIFKNFLFLLGTVIFSALLCAIINMFTGFLTAYVYQAIKK